MEERLCEEKFSDAFHYFFVLSIICGVISVIEEIVLLCYNIRTSFAFLLPAFVIVTTVDFKLNLKCGDDGFKDSIKNLVPEKLKPFCVSFSVLPLLNVIVKFRMYATVCNLFHYTAMYDVLMYGFVFMCIISAVVVINLLICCHKAFRDDEE